MNRFSRLFLSTSKMVKPVKIGTHDGAFHCDEVFACVMLRMLPEFANLRTSKYCPNAVLFLVYLLRGV